MASHIIYYYLMLFIGTYILTSIGIQYFKINNESLFSSSHPLEGCPKDGVVFSVSGCEWYRRIMLWPCVRGRARNPAGRPRFELLETHSCASVGRKWPAEELKRRPDSKKALGGRSYSILLGVMR